MAPLETRCERRWWAAFSPPAKGWTVVVLKGKGGGVGRPRDGSASRGSRRAALRDWRVVGMLNGDC
jgi:hypothetical protein